MDNNLMNRIVFSSDSICDNNKIQEVSFDITMDDNISRMVSEFRLFLLGMGYHPDTVDEYVPYCDVTI